MTKIAILAVDETVRIDLQRLEQIIGELGEATAVQVIGAALEQLALALRRTLAASRQGDLGAAVSNADQLSRLAWQVGLVTLAGVAIDVGACAERRDRPALAATTRRLERIGNRSLTELWDVPENS
ncbi:hypothetical protein NM680_03030 [Paracoccus sp. PS-1]|uniref:hypothetical protein n=1 Tax=unclassified Paracoccus (in: a-proteobacteria) TaxID=2688777 RepID=UPI00048B80F0|nr:MULTISPECIES: hypothetical protein [unclassified Paracoccus (in: a-proteobacteria)]MDQ7260770.1 hypothetical protein [Paracoccus sp. PS1]RQP03971.1 MAG: hypothetical protein D1H97_20610 [Paracoccus sp. BP8]RQP06147.1 MAG: hypothetical protein D1H97_08985 [Paracoccus sp. BP8]UFM65734.1 hypothetical protein LOS78_07160 [Paracoccus sp. MA]